MYRIAAADAARRTIITSSDDASVVVANALLPGELSSVGERS
jgi:hypothetical protein